MTNLLLRILNDEIVPNSNYDNEMATVSRIRTVNTQHIWVSETGATCTLREVETFPRHRGKWMLTFESKYGGSMETTKVFPNTNSRGLMIEKGKLLFQRFVDRNDEEFQIDVAQQDRLEALSNILDTMREKGHDEADVLEAKKQGLATNRAITNGAKQEVKDRYYSRGK